jgi:hypothetical protein
MQKKLIISLAFAATLIFIPIGIHFKNKNESAKALQRLKIAVSKDFHDPESAKFRNIRLQSLEGTVAQKIQELDISYLLKNPFSEILSTITYDPQFFELCGEVNAKNRLGAYIGYKKFYIRGNDGIPFIDQDSDNAEKFCKISSDSIIINSTE